ncbi:MAG: zf-HC2 domain-containing protein [Dehalococcoidia bacterium]
MNCDQIDELLSDFIDDELSEGVRAGVEAHLRACDVCAVSYKNLIRTVRFVKKNGRAPLHTFGGENYATFVRALSDPAYHANPVQVLAEGIIDP